MRLIATNITTDEIEKKAKDIIPETIESIDFGFIEIKDARWRLLFDEALEIIHYAGSCQRVGRCMRLAIIDSGRWVGGIVLGSTFPNILVRDEALGLREYVKGYQERGIKSPWSKENDLYWKNLQKIINHARTFIFPKYQFEGKGIKAHKLLLTKGISMWKSKYHDEVIGLDTLCTHNDSRLFKDNGWTLVGKTKGYTSDPTQVFSKNAFKEEWGNIKNNVALGKTVGSQSWFVWTIKV